MMIKRIRIPPKCSGKTASKNVKTELEISKDILCILLQFNQLKFGRRLLIIWGHRIMMDSYFANRESENRLPWAA